MVVVAIPSSGNGGLNDEMDPRFGRCMSFTFVTLENNEVLEVKVVKNHANEAMGGAGIEAARIVGENKASIVIVGFLGPNAANGLTSLNLKILQASNRNITVKQALDMYIRGELSELTASNVGPHYGMGMGGGRGMGGGGRGMGGGRNQF